MQIKLAPDLSLLAIVVIFFINYLVVRMFFIRPVSRVMEERETEVRTAEELHQKALERFNEATARTEAQLHVAKRDAAAIRDRYRAEASAHRSKVIERTHGEAQQVVGEADKKLSDDVKVAREKIGRDSEALARLAAERILGRAI